MTDGDVLAPNLSLDVAFDVLADSNRRDILSYFTTGPDQADLQDLVDYVGTANENRHTATTLHHLHLPKLAEAGLIRYDHERKMVVARDSIQDLEPYLEWARQHAQ